jgi:hypothetical protein
MMDDEQPPPRLLQTLGPAGDCVREVLSQEELAPCPPRFAQLQERRARRVKRQRGLALVGLALALVGARALQQEEPLPGIQAEHTVSSSSQQLAAPSSALPGELPLQRELPAPLSSKPEGPTPAPPKAVAPRPSGQALVRVDEPQPPSADAVGKRVNESAAGGGAKACAQLARGGASEPALACYAKLASGTGMSAELALFEQARLEGKALRRPERALLTLDDYRRRFPNGSLRAEVMLAQIDWLLAAGNSTRALEVVDEALASGLLRERSAELTRLRSRLGAAH